MPDSDRLDLTQTETFDVQLDQQFDSDGSITPSININHNPTLTMVLNSYGVDSVTTLYANRSPNIRPRPLRAGVLIGLPDNPTHYTETDLLELVPGISETLADALIGWFTDIPTLCQRLRNNPDVLHEVRLDAPSNATWITDLEQFQEMVSGSGESFEQRLKDVGVWEEPDTDSPETL